MISKIFYETFVFVLLYIIYFYSTFKQIFEERNWRNFFVKRFFVNSIDIQTLFAAYRSKSYCRLIQQISVLTLYVMTTVDFQRLGSAGWFLSWVHENANMHSLQKAFSPSSNKLKINSPLAQPIDVWFVAGSLYWYHNNKYLTCNS